MKRTANTLKNKLWKVFSEYIRKRDDWVCISCGKPLRWNEGHAGHFVARNRSLNTYFDEQNVNLQCCHCNLYLSGNLYKYWKALEKKYGKDMPEELERRSKITRQIKPIEYEQLIEYYKGKLKEFWQNDT